VKVSNQTFIGFCSQPKDTVSLPVIRSLMIDRYDDRASISFWSQSFNESCLEYFKGTLHVIGSTTAHKLYAGTDWLALTIPTLSVSLTLSRLIVSYWTLVADNYAPMVSHILMVLYGTKADNRLPAARHMRLFGDLLSGDLTSPKQVCSIFGRSSTAPLWSLELGRGMVFQGERVLWGEGPHAFRDINNFELRRINARFARNHIRIFIQIRFRPLGLWPRSRHL
jgi:hypothetical protein